MKYKSLIFIAIAVVVMSLTLLILKTDDSYTVIFAYHDGGTNGFTIDLRSNGEYEIKNNSWLTSTDFNGHYTLVDNMVTLDRKNIDNVILTDKLKICSCPGQPSWTCLLQVDEHGNDIDTHFGFTIQVDNRQ
jgi:hypothetical protein